MKKRKLEGEKMSRVEKKQKIDDPKAVMFCPYTLGGELAKRLREVESDMEKSSGYKIKIVEESGEKVFDILHSSNPWKGEVYPMCHKGPDWEEQEARLQKEKFSV